MAQVREQRDRRWVWVAAVILLVLVFFVARTQLRERLPVRVARVSYADLANTLSTNGRVEPEVNFEIHSPIATTVKAVFVQPGDVVPAGKLLMQLDDLEARARLATAESGVKAAEAAVEAATHNGSRQEQQAAAGDLMRTTLDRDQARHDLDALIQLKATGAASSSEVAQARQRLDSTEASLRAAEQSAHSRYAPVEIERARASLADAQANLAAARQVLDQTTIHAPIAGTVYSLGVARTEYAETGKLLLQMADLHHERVRAYFDEPEIGKLAVGEKIQIKWDAKPDRVWNGHIERVPVTVITYGTRNVGEVLVQIDDADGELLPETNVSVKVTTSNEPHSLTIPHQALYSEAGQYFVYKMVQDQLQRTPVTIGTYNVTDVKIVSGLQEGDQVATGTLNSLPLQEGVPIKEVR